MGLIVLAMAACAWNGGFWWFMLWRTLAGVGGGLLMALAGPATQASVAPGQRGIAGGVVLMGVGLGIAAGALTVPALLPQGLPATWLGLAAVVLLLWLFAHPRWPDMALGATPGAAAPEAADRRRARLLVVSYGLHAAGMVPPMVYLADLAARGRGLGVGIGAAVWFVFGLGAVIGSVASGRLVDRLGGLPTLILWLLAQAAALSLALLPAAWLVLPTAVLAGFAAVGTTSVTLSVSRAFTDSAAAATALWVQSTAAFAVMQTLVGFALAGLFAATGESHAAVFGAGLLFCIASLGVALVLARIAGLRPPQPG
jgi:predicted MFS family arabinose efflux permease